MLIILPIDTDEKRNYLYFFIELTDNIDKSALLQPYNDY